MWFYVIVLVLVAIMAVTMQPRGAPEPKPPTLQDIEVPTAEQGRPIPVVFGTYLLKSPNVVWYGDLRYEKIKKSSGGK